MNAFDLACTDMALALYQLAESDYRRHFTPGFYQQDEIKKVLSALTNKILHLLDLGEEIIKQKDEQILQ